MWLRNYKTKEPITADQLKYSSTSEDSVADALEGKANEADIESLLLYKAGDTYSINTNAIFPACITASTTVVSIGVHVPKSMRDVTPRLTALTGGLRGPSGMVNGSSDSTDWLTQSGITATLMKNDDYTVRVDLTKTSAFTNVPNNTTLSLKGTIALSFE